MTDAERQKVRYWRGKMLKAGVADVRLLPKTAKLSDREIALVNGRFDKLKSAAEPVKLAA